MRSGRCGQADGFGVAVMKNRPMTRVNLDKAIARMAVSPARQRPKSACREGRS